MILGLIKKLKAENKQCKLLLSILPNKFRSVYRYTLFCDGRIYSNSHARFNAVKSISVLRTCIPDEISHYYLTYGSKFVDFQPNVFKSENSFGNKWFLYTASAFIITRISRYQVPCL